MMRVWRRELCHNSVQGKLQRLGGQRTKLCPNMPTTRLVYMNQAFQDPAVHSMAQHDGECQHSWQHTCTWSAPNPRTVAGPSSFAASCCSCWACCCACPNSCAMSPLPSDSLGPKCNGLAGLAEAAAVPPGCCCCCALLRPAAVCRRICCIASCSPAARLYPDSAELALLCRNMSSVLWLLIDGTDSAAGTGPVDGDIEGNCCTLSREPPYVGPTSIPASSNADGSGC